MQRVYDKINYQTNFTAPSTFAILLKAVKDNGIVRSEDGKATIFPNARHNAGMNYNPLNRDTHGEISLKQYGLIDYVTVDSFKISYLGERFLELFDNDFKAKDGNDFNYNSVMIDCLLSWKDDSYDRNIHPGLLVLKLLSDSRLGEYITDYDWAFTCEHADLLFDSDYDKLISQILEFRESNNNISLKKADVFLGGFAGAWGIFNKSVEDGKNKFTLTEMTKQNLKSKKIEYRLLKNDSIVDTEYAKLSYLGMNKIYYGTPGCGKSYRVKEKYCLRDADGKRLYIRTIFHPDYTNADFIGQLLPVKNGQDISYEFKRGPFVDALILAYNNPGKNIALVIEELNRGNAAAIFGELFQLLDRNEKGESEYGIKNQYITEELIKYVINNYEYDFSEIKIPSNLSLIATMNTSDQNVYPLDNAFQRRWKMEKIRNNFFKDPNIVISIENVGILDKEENYVSKRAYELAHWLIPGTAVTWREFVIEMNNRIVNPMFNEYINDDKQIGIYFLNEDELAVECPGEDINAKKKNFAEKMLKYIWEDIAKINPETWFENGFESLDKILDGYNEKQLSIFKKSEDFKEIKKPENDET